MSSVSDASSLSLSQVCGHMSYLSLSLISSTALLCPLGTFARCCADICGSAFPLLLACLSTSSVFAFAGYCGGFSPWSLHLCPLACLTLAAPLAPPGMVVLLRRVAGPLISALSLISAAPLTHFYWTFWAWLFEELQPSSALPSVAPAGEERSAPLSGSSFIDSGQGAVAAGLPVLGFPFLSLQSRRTSVLHYFRDCCLVARHESANALKHKSILA